MVKKEKAKIWKSPSDIQKKQMGNTPKQTSKETYIVIGIFVLMLFLKIFMKSELSNARISMCRDLGGCTPLQLNAGIGIIFQPSFWIMSLAFVAYSIAFIAEVLFLISFLTRKRISPYLAIALGIGICILSYVFIS